jgi:PilZ domain
MTPPGALEPNSGELRYRCAVPVTLRKKGMDLALLTSEVSFGGAFVRTQSAPPVNSLVRLGFTLPPDDAKITLSAHVTQVIPQDASGDHYPGFAVRFVGLDGPVKQRWEALVQSLRGEEMGARDTTVVFAPLSYLELFQANGPAAGDVWLQPQSVEELERIVKEEVPLGLVFVPTDGPVTPGANVTIQLLHPVTQAVFALEGVVKRPRPGAQQGAVVAIAPLSHERRVELSEMADSVVVVEDYDVELYEEPALSSSS